MGMVQFSRFNAMKRYEPVMVYKEKTEGVDIFHNIQNLPTCHRQFRILGRNRKVLPSTVLKFDFEAAEFAAYHVCVPGLYNRRQPK